MNIAPIETEIATGVLKAALARNLWVAVNNGEEELPRTNALDDAVACLRQTDEDVINIYGGPDAARVGWFYLVYGNSGWDVIADYNANELCEDIYGEVEPIISKWEDTNA